MMGGSWERRQLAARPAQQACADGLPAGTHPPPCRRPLPARSPARALAVLPCAAAVAEVRQLERGSPGIEDLDSFLRDMGLVVQVRALRGAR